MGSFGVCIELPGLFGGGRICSLEYFVYSRCALLDDKNVLEPFAFTEDKRKEVRDIIQERERSLEDEHVSFLHIPSSFGRVPTTI